MITFNRTIVLSFAAGAVLGALGYKLISSNKGLIDEKLKNMGIVPNDATGACTGESCASNTDVTLEELESQKERLEDLIAERKSQTGE